MGWGPQRPRSGSCSPLPRGSRSPTFHRAGGGGDGERRELGHDRRFPQGRDRRQQGDRRVEGDADQRKQRDRELDGLRFCLAGEPLERDAHRWPEAHDRGDEDGARGGAAGPRRSDRIHHLLTSSRARDIADRSGPRISRDGSEAASGARGGRCRRGPRGRGGDRPGDRARGFAAGAPPPPDESVAREAPAGRRPADGQRPGRADRGARAARLHRVRAAGDRHPGGRAVSADREARRARRSEHRTSGSLLPMHPVPDQARPGDPHAVPRPVLPGAPDPRLPRPRPFPLDGDRIAFFNDPNCSSTEGTYRWSEGRESLRFRVVEDPCPFKDERSTDFGYSPWIRVDACTFRIMDWWPALLGCSR